jgi:hypothetical protein
VILDEIEQHRAACTKCRPWSVCDVAAAMLSRLTHSFAERIAPIPKPAVKA